MTSLETKNPTTIIRMEFIKKHPLIFFVIICYSISWTFLFPAYNALKNAEAGSFPPLALLGIIGGFGPSISALITVYITEGKKKVKLLLKKILIGRASIKVYLFVLTIPIVLQFIGVFSSSFWGYELGGINLIEGLKIYFPYLILAIPFGPLMEELGWRGYMLPKLLENNRPVKASLIIGVVWTIWHLASFTFPGAAIPSALEVSSWSLGIYMVTIVAESVVFTFLYFKSNGSVLLAILLHASFNANENIVFSFFPQLIESPDYIKLTFILFAISLSVFAAALILYNKKIMQDVQN